MLRLRGLYDQYAKSGFVADAGDEGTHASQAQPSRVRA